MATFADSIAKSEEYRLREHFILENNMVTCDFCRKSYAICIRKEDIMKHLLRHKNDIQSTVSLEESQEDWKSEFYEIQNNSIKCKFCNETYISKNTKQIIKIHLEKIHEVKEDTAENICKWLRKYYNFEETDAKQYCKIWNNSIPNKSLFLMKHLIEAHQHVVPLQIRPKGLLNSFLFSDNWMWTYFTRIKKNAICSICVDIYILKEPLSSIHYHIKREHDNNYDVSENSQKNKKPYSITENNQIKCDICDKTYDRKFYITKQMENHLANKHNLNENKAYNVCTWVLKNFHVLDFQKAKCKMCKNISKNNSFFNLVIHLNESHDVPVSSEIIPARLPSFRSFLNSAKDTATSSRYQQPTQNFDQISDSDNLYNQMDESAENRSTRYAENNATSSSYQQPTQNVDQISDSYNIYDQIAESTENRSRRYAEANATSSRYQQLTQNFDQISESNNLYDQMDEFSENRSTRYAENNATSCSYHQPTQNFDEISDFYNIYDEIAESMENKSSRYAENNATSCSYHQPTQNFDEISDSYNFYDQIAESTENRSTRYAEVNAISSRYQQLTQNFDQISNSDNL